MDGNVVRLMLYGQQAYAALARARDADTALLYVYAAAAGGSCREEEAIADLGLDSPCFKKAVSLLRLYGLAKAEQTPLPEKIPEDMQDIAAARQGDPMFAHLCGYLEAALGRVLRRAELEILFGVYDGLAMPADVLVFLINYCKEIGRLSARELEKNAYRWRDEGIDTYERAAEYLEEQKKQRSREWELRRIMGISDRRPSDTERKYIDDWAGQGFPDDLVKLAYDRTVTRTGKMNWSYMNKILLNWKEKGFKTADDAIKGEVRAAPAASNGPSAEAQSIEAAVLRAYGEKRKQREQRQAARLEELKGLSPKLVEIEGRRRLCASKLARADQGQRAELEEELKSLAQQRAAALEELGKPPDWLDIKPDCPLCYDRGYIGAKKCRCFEEACRSQRENPRL